MLYARQVSLQSQLALTNPNLTSTVSGQGTPSTLIELNAELNRLASKYSENHPNIKAIKRKIANYKPSVNQSGGQAINNPAYLQAKAELDITILELRNSKSQRSRLQEKLSSLEARISQTPHVERGYNDLLRDLDNNKEKYKELRAKYLEAKLAQTLEEEQKAEKFSILEPPRVPTTPDKPDRLKIFFLGFVVSIGGGIGIGFLAEMMDGSIRGYRSLEYITGFEPLIVIPYIQNEGDKQKIRKNLISFAIFGLILLIAMIAAIHILYMPLDMIWFKVLHKLNTL
ncbi:MAG: hypothetical protein HAW67_01095 [Endozoicomonadaceae bacterium]|nr:hypothetical protein [Endozoicomonadaceae bacterium]